MENQVAQLEHWTARNPPMLTHFFNSLAWFRHRAPLVRVARYAPMLSLWWLVTTRLAPYLRFSKCVTAVSSIRPSWFRLRGEAFFGCSVISLKLTVNQVS